MIEEQIQKLTEALEANTAAILASQGGTAKATTSSTEKKPAAKKSAAKKTAAAKKTPAKKAAKSKDAEVTHDTLRNEIKSAREVLREEHGADAVAAHKDAFRGILEELGASNVTSIPEESVAEVFQQLKDLTPQALGFGEEEEELEEADDDLE